ncbi:hypothetical protein [Psychroflexus aestuariivivens]|uniref:hypothetical protein n=1 Tax=Psychroflexus aestuariivivens TaxID=1795040 RepID=UPI000FD7D258|nr:hypothetical protein [Psychroflexus aestuariivivens]
MITKKELKDLGFTEINPLENNSIDLHHTNKEKFPFKINLSAHGIAQPILPKAKGDMFRDINKLKDWLSLNFS